MRTAFCIKSYIKMSPKITPLTAISVLGDDFYGLGQSTAVAHLSLVGRSAVSGKQDKPGL